MQERPELVNIFLSCLSRVPNEKRVPPPSSWRTDKCGLRQQALTCHTKRLEVIGTKFILNEVPDFVAYCDMAVFMCLVRRLKSPTFPNQNRMADTRHRYHILAARLSFGHAGNLTGLHTGGFGALSFFLIKKS